MIPETHNPHEVMATGFPTCSHMLEQVASKFKNCDTRSRAKKKQQRMYYLCE